MDILCLMLLAILSAATYGVVKLCEWLSRDSQEGRS
jgi:hypothetical protein